MSHSGGLMFAVVTSNNAIRQPARGSVWNCDEKCAENKRTNHNHPVK
jgi:hypothetical protein